MVFEENCGRSRVSGGLVFSGLIASAQAVVLPAAIYVWAVWHRVPALAPVFAGLARMLQVPAEAHGSVVAFGGGDAPILVSVSPERLGYLLAVPFLIAAGGHLLIARHRWWHTPLLVVGVGAYCIVRSLFIWLAELPFPAAERLDLAWHPFWLAVSFVPLAVIMMKVVRGPEDVVWDLRPQAAARWAGVLGRGGLAAAAGACFVCFLGYRDRGIPKRGRVIIDEKHSDWEDTTRRMDTEWYGELSTYNYSNFAEHIGRYFDVSTNLDDELTDGLLRDCDVLVIKTPTNSFDREEVVAIERFVDEGGGLWLIGDHTNVFGMGTYLNQLARRFGLRFNYDSVYQLGTGKLNLYKRPRLLPHPIVINVPEFLYATSCTLSVAAGNQRVMTSPGLRSVEHDYSQPGFFPDEDRLHHGGREWFGPFVQCAAAKHGKGRVVALSDSTQFSNFFIYIAGRPELVLATVDWLNCSNGPCWPKRMAGMLGVVLGILFLVTNPPGWGGGWGITCALVGASLGFGVGARATHAVNRSHFHLPAPQVSIPSIAFEMEHSSIFLPRKHLVTRKERWENYLTFLVWSQRVGLVPSHHDSVECACRTGKSVAIINPTKVFDARECREVRAFVEAGGYLLLMVGRKPTAGHVGAKREDDGAGGGYDDRGLENVALRERVANQVLRGFDMTVDLGSPCVGEEFVTNDGQTLCKSYHAGRVFGGNAVLRNSDGGIALAERSAGSGKVIVFTD